MPDLNPADDGFAAHLRERLPEAAFRPPSPGYFEEPRGRFRAAGGLVVAPSSTDEVAEVVRLCAQARVALVPYGGGTGLVGGQIGEGLTPVVLSLERMTRISDVRPEEQTLTAQAGAILADVQAAAAEAGLLFPLSLASEGSARMGGLLATNAGGINTLRYGNARRLCLGVEAVLPSGEVLSGLTRLRKDNTGYDLRDLLIGSEGTLGIITAATLELSPRPTSEATALIVVPGLAEALALLTRFRAELGDGISAFEIIGGQGWRFLDEVGPETAQPFLAAPEWCVLVELGTFTGDARAALETVFAAALDDGVVTDGVIAESEAQRAAFWHIRESLPEANRRIGAVSSHDISVPLGAIPGFIAQGTEAVKQLGPFRINCFGHIGDGNLHFNVFPDPGKTRADYLPERDKIKQVVHDLTHGMGGSVSAEHGVGRLKTGDLERYAEPAKLAALRAIKGALDPLGIMNPGVILAA